MEFLSNIIREEEFQEEVRQPFKWSEKKYDPIAFVFSIKIFKRIMFAFKNPDKKSSEIYIALRIVFTFYYLTSKCQAGSFFSMTYLSLF